MFQELLHIDPQVLSAFIGAVGAIATAIIGAVFGLYAAKTSADRKKLVEYVETAQQDIEFLLAVEATYCQILKEEEGVSPKIKIRGIVNTQGKSWSGRFTPSRNKARQPRLTRLK